jgi:hypothetical protein
VFEGILALQRGAGHHGVLPAYVALALSGAAEGISLLRAARQTRAQARERGVPLLRHVRSSPDITADDISADQAEDVADRIDAELARSLPVVPHVFLDPTQLRNGRSG